MLDHHDEGDEESVGWTSSPLVAADPVSAAVTQSCTTAVVKGLAVQLVEEIECLRPKTMKRIDKAAGLSLGTAAAGVPFLQTPAADALVAAQKARGVTMTINSGLRTLPQQYLLYRWYQTGRCGISLAAKPGTSNHESAVAVDIGDNAAWRSAMQGKGFRWLGASDPVHYDFTGAGAVNLRGLSVKAFQRLWNRNHPEDPIAEDGAYGTETEKRLARSPVGGFPKGAPASCTTADAGTDAGPATQEELPPVPDATEEDDGAGDTAPAAAPAGPGTADTESAPGARTRGRGEAGGCAAAPTGRGAGVAAALAAVAFVSLAARRRRARIRAPRA